MFLISTGCALAPITNLYTARSQGKGNGELALGAATATGSGTSSSAIPVIKFDYGISDNFDLGLKYETIDFGLFAKYALINQKSGLSWALAGSYGATLGGTYWYGGTVLSYKAGFIEPYFSARFNQVSWDRTTWSSSTITITTPATTFNYFQYTGGLVIWPSEKIGLDLEYDTLTSTQAGLTFSNTGFAAAALIIKFN